MKAAVLLPAILLAAGMAGAQDYLNCHFAPGWEPSGAKRDYVSDNLYDYKDGGAEGYLIFGFVRMQGITCASGENTLDIDVSQMADADAAYGIFAANRDPRLPVVRIGMGGQVQPQSASFARGSYYVEIVEVASEPNRDDSATMRAFATGIEARIEGRDTAPEALQWFPQEGLASVRLVPERTGAQAAPARLRGNLRAGAGIHRAGGLAASSRGNSQKPARTIRRSRSRSSRRRSLSSAGKVPGRRLHLSQGTLRCGVRQPACIPAGGCACR
jgi:hypothetical protein